MISIYNNILCIINIMIEWIFPLIIIIILWYIAHDCNNKLAQNLSKPAILIFTSFFYFIIILIYMYFHMDHCYNHLPVLNIELVVLLLLVPAITIVSTLMFMHATLPKIISR